MNTTEIRQDFQHVGDNMADLPIGYKRNDIGVIPQDWRVETISSVADVKTGPFGSALHERDYVDDGTPIITVEHLSEHGIIHHNLPMISDADRSRLKSYGLRVGDIVFSRVGSIDRNALVRNKEDGWLFSGRLLRVRTLDNTTYPPYLSYHFHSEPFKRRVRGVAVGQTMASLNTQILKAVCVVLPTTPEQRAIAEALSDVDGLLAALEALIAKKRAVKQAAMQQLLTGKTRLPGFSGKWETKSFEEVFKRLNAKTHHIQTSEYSTHGLHPVIDQGQAPIVAFSDRTDKLFECLTGGVIIFGDHTRIVKFINMNFLIGADGTQLLAMQRHHAVTKFFFYQLLTKDIPNTGYNRHFKFLQDLTFEVPTSAEQKAIASVLSDMDAEIAALERRRDKTRAIKHGMMQQLLTGRVRLVKPTLIKKALAC